MENDVNLSDNQGNENSENSNEMRSPDFQDYHNKLNTLKLRYGLLKKDINESPSKKQASHSPNSEKHQHALAPAVNSGINTNLSQKKRAAETDSSSTEEILHKLSEMKTKMNNIVNASKNITNS